MSVEKGPFGSVVFLKAPAAQTSFAPTMATAISKLLTDPRGFGLVITFQLVPSQCSMRVCPLPPPKLLGPGRGEEKPTAHTSFVLTAATLKRALSPLS